MVSKYFETNLHSDDHPSDPDYAALEHGSAPSVEDYEDPNLPPPAMVHGVRTNAPPTAARVNPSFKKSSTSLITLSV